jgi:hypothetical protein
MKNLSFMLQERKRLPPHQSLPQALMRGALR